MRTFITKQQLAFIMGTSNEEARAVMCSCWAKEKGIKNTAKINQSGKIEDGYPDAMEIAMIERNANLPNLQFAVNDICNNYLKRPSSRKWILCDYPEKEIEKIYDGKKKSLNVPSSLKAILPASIIDEIRNEWIKRYPKVLIK